MFTFEKLKVWHKGVDFADSVYTATKAFPDDERFGLTSQMRRAAVSISSNIAEGSSRHSDGDFARFVEIAAGSLYEVVTQALIAKRQNMLSGAAFERLYAEAEEEARMLSGLRDSLLEKK